MKLRIRENPIRLRLIKPEVASVCSGGIVESTIALGSYPNCFPTYRVQSVGSVSDAQLQYAGNILSVLLPESAVREWEHSETTGIYGEENRSHGKSLKIAVEKDSKCLDNRKGEDETGAYPHPLTQKRKGASDNP